MMTTLFAVIAFVIAIARADAQTMTWVQPDTDLTTAQSYRYDLEVDGVVSTAPWSTRAPAQRPFHAWRHYPPSRQVADRCASAR